MKKLKKQKINQLINYQIYFKKIKINAKKIIYENSFLLSFNDIKIIENNIDHNALIFNNNITNNTISTIEQKYNNSFRFNYKLTFYILEKFHNNILKNQIKKKIISTGLTIIKAKKSSKNILISKQQISNKKNTSQYFYLLFGYLFKLKNNKLIKYSLIVDKKLDLQEKKVKIKILWENQLKFKKIIIQKQEKKFNISRINYLLYIINLYQTEMIMNLNCVDTFKKHYNASI